MVRPRCQPHQLRGARTPARGVQRRRQHPRRARQQRVLHHRLRPEQPLRGQHPHHREVAARQSVDRRALRCRQQRLCLYQALPDGGHAQAPELPRRQSRQPAAAAHRHRLPAHPRDLRWCRRRTCPDGHRRGQLHRREGLQGQGQAHRHMAGRQGGRARTAQTA